MVRENSFSDSDGRSLTPDLSEDEDPDFVVSSPVSATSPPARRNPSQTRLDQNGVFPSPSVQPTGSGVAILGRDGTAAGSGLPHSGSPSVLFKDASTDAPPPDLNLPKLSQTASAPAVSMRNDTAPIQATRQMSPRDRFRSAVRKVIHMHRGSSALSLGNIGAEPGIDPRRASAFLSYGHIKQKCTIELIDYSPLRASFGRMENRGFAEYMMDAKASRRESWVKVRWINIGGVSWDVISSLALHYDIHPLALEDVLHQRGNQARSKADYYLKHLFIRVLRHRLCSDEDEDDGKRETIAPSVTRLPRSSSPDAMHADEGESLDSWKWSEEKRLSGSKFSTRRIGSLKKTRADLEQGQQQAPQVRGHTTRSTLSHRKRAAETMTIEQLKRGERVNVDVIPFFIFFFKDGTVISINQTPDIDFTVPIITRLRQRDTGLRATADPSLLVQSLLDLVVDQALEIVDEYQLKILKLEREILIKPKMNTVRYLHIMSGDLTLHKRTLEPIKTLVYGLRRYDVDRYTALLGSSGEGESDGNSSVKVQGFMSHKAKIYLADVHDHIDYIINSFDMFETVAENLINYTFNMASYQMNEVMRRLTLATIIFLPLTLLTGYFGMNFQRMWSVTQSDVLFWEIAIPVLIVVIPMFTWPDIQRFIHFCEKSWTTRKVQKQALRHSPKKTQ